MEENRRRYRCYPPPTRPVVGSSTLGAGNLPELATRLSKVYGGASHVVSWAPIRLRKLGHGDKEDEDSEDDGQQANRQRRHDRA